MRKYFRYGFILVLLWLPLSCSTIPASTGGRLTPSASPSASQPVSSPSPFVTTPQPAAVYTYSIVNVYPHATDAFTQGLAFEDGVLYEGTGLRGSSSLRKIDLVTGNITQIYRLPNAFFGEGIAIWGDTIIQMLYETNKGFIYAKNTFRLRREFNYSTQGWGVTHNNKHLIVSNGSATLHFLEPDAFNTVRSIEVHDGGKPVNFLNELEYVNDRIYANVWMTDRIAIIEPESGLVSGWLDLRGILRDYTQHVDVLNGIAYDAKSDRLFVTGKLWPRLFEIRLVER